MSLTLHAEYLTSVTSKGQVTIPKHIRQKLGIHKGSKMQFTLDDAGNITMTVAKTTPGKKPFVSGMGLVTSKANKAVPVDFDVSTLMTNDNVSF